MKTLLILFSLFVFITSCDNSNDKKCFFAESIIELSDVEVAIHQNSGKSMLTLEDQKKIFENENEGVKLLKNISKEYGANNREIMNEIMECSDTREIISKNSDLIVKIKSERELDDFYIKEIINKSIKDLKAMSACETIETMGHLANYQLALFNKYGDLSKGKHKETLNKIIKISVIVSEITKKNHSEAELKKCAFYDTFLYMTNKLGDWKKNI